MDVVLVSTLSKSCLSKSSSSSGYALRQVEDNKFNKDLRNSEPLQLSATKRFIPLAMNQLGRRGSHFEVALREHAFLMIKRPSGCRLLQGALTVPHTTALAKVLSAWGADLTWTAQREYAAQIIKAVESHIYRCSSIQYIHRGFEAEAWGMHVKATGGHQKWLEHRGGTGSCWLDAPF